MAFGDGKFNCIMLSKDDIAEKVKTAAEEITRDYEDKPLLLVGILTGSFIFMADLCREIDTPCEIGFMAAESYFEGTSSSGEVKITLDLKQDISKYHVIIVEDIIDTGRTLNAVYNILKARDPLSLRVYTLLDKPARREVDFEPYRAMITLTGSWFAVGYGMDCGEKFRTLPFIAELNEKYVK